jgi:hypothetical protein
MLAHGVPEHRGGPITVLGHCTASGLDSLLTGWRDICGRRGSVDWLIERATSGPPAARGGLTMLRRSWSRELLLFLAAYAIYGLARYAAIGDPAVAADNARWIVDLGSHIDAAGNLVSAAAGAALLACPLRRYHPSSQRRLENPC